MPKTFDNNQAMKELNSTGIHPRAVRIAGEEPIGGQKMSGEGGGAGRIGVGVGVGVGVNVEVGEGTGEGGTVGVKVAVGKVVIVE